MTKKQRSQVYILELLFIEHRKYDMSNRKCNGNMKQTVAFLYTKLGK